MAIYDREAIAGLRRRGKHDLADHYERAMAVDTTCRGHVITLAKRCASLGFDPASCRVILFCPEAAWSGRTM